MSPGVRFIVAHDTGNPGSTAAANVKYYERSRNEMSASAHIFVDDKEIVECIPAAHFRAVAEPALRAGMTASVSVDTKRQRTLGSLFGGGTAFATGP